MAQRRAAFTQAEGTRAPLALRNHSDFLNSYSPEDQGLYSDAQGR